MIFSKKTWKSGDSLNPDALNRMENGIYEANSRLDKIGTSLTVQAGRELINTSAHKTSGQTIFEQLVEFPTAFSSKPFVTVSAETGAPDKVSASVKGSSYVTNSGFVVVLYRDSDSPSTSVSWIATAPAT